MARTKWIPEARAFFPENAGSDLFADLVYKTLERKESFQLNWQFYVGPKSLEKLEAVDPDLTGIINYGFFQTIGRWLHFLLKLFNGYVGNWGIAIIIGFLNLYLLFQTVREWMK